jgi:Skp family chaperone for outer membrane proteins
MTRHPSVRLVPLVAFALLGALGWAAPRARAGTEKIGIVHLRYVLVHSKAGLSAEKRFVAYRTRIEKQFRVQEKRLAEEQQMLRARLPKESRAARERDIKAFTTGEQNLRKKFLKIRASLYAEHTKLFQPIEKELITVVRRYAAKHGYGLILDGSQAGVVLANGSYDLTPRILAALNATPPPKG